MRERGLPVRNFTGKKGRVCLPSRFEVCGQNACASYPKLTVHTSTIWNASPGNSSDPRYHRVLEAGGLVLNLPGDTPHRVQMRGNFRLALYAIPQRKLQDDYLGREGGD